MSASYLLRLSSVSMATSMEITFDCSFVLDPSFCVSQGGASPSEASPDSMDCRNRHAKFFHWNHCIGKKHTSISQKGPMWVFFRFWNSPSSVYSTRHLSSAEDKNFPFCPQLRTQKTYGKQTVFSKPSTMAYLTMVVLPSWQLLTQY